MGAATLDLLTATLGGVNELKVVLVNICASVDNVYRNKYKYLDLFGTI